jgi:hypothetical protein
MNLEYGLYSCIGFIGVTIGIFSMIYGSKKTFKFIHTNIFDDEMAINISINIGLISLLLGIFFFTYATVVEENIVKTNAIIGVSNIMDMIGPLLNNDIKKEMLKNLTIPDQTKEDKKVKDDNDALMHNSYSQLLVILDIGLTIGFILCIIFEHSFIKVLGLNLIIVTLVGCTEYIFLNFIPNNYISVDTNFIRYTILTELKKKVTIDGQPLG